MSLDDFVSRVIKMASARTGLVSFCPHGDLCGKKGKRLGWDEKEEDARARIANHLTSSTYHAFAQEEAEAAANAAELIEELYYEKPPNAKAAWIPHEPPAAAEAKSKGRGRGSWGNNEWGSSGWRADPYARPPAAPPPMATTAEVVREVLLQEQQRLQAVTAVVDHGVGGGGIGGGGFGGGHMLANAGNRSHPLHERLILSVSRAEAGARAASRMASQAYMAFNEEANALRECLDAIRGIQW